MDGLSAYQRMRKANLSENTQFLMEYGLQAPVVETTSVIQIEKREKKQKPLKAIKKRPAPEGPPIERRTSFRVRLKVRPDYFHEFESLKDSDDEDEAELLKNLSQPNRKIVRPPRPNSYGSIKGVKVGTWWETRLDCNYDGIHRPTVAGIHPGPDGAYSVALSGGYEDDVDLGDSFTYTGEGGRDLKGTASNPKNLRTAPQSKHQALVRGNLALSLNVSTGNPVRVIRGYKLNSNFAPDRGYRYDGLYNITKYWETTGKAGYRVFKFQFERCDPEPAPWDKSAKTSSPQNMSNSSIDADSDWNGWSAQEIPHPSVCLRLVFQGEAERVCLKGENWQKVTDSDQEQNSVSVVSVCQSTSDQCLEFQENCAEETCNKVTMSRPNNCDATSVPCTNEVWCGWDKDIALKHYQSFILKYKECAVRVYEKEGRWEEISSHDI